MDAKILKAAVSAAIKVTITSTLVGCGGMVTSSGGGPGPQPTAGAADASAEGNATKSSVDPVSPGYPKSEPASGGQAGTEPMLAAAAPGGGTTGGGTATTAEAGTAGANGGSPEATCAGAEVDACYAFLAQAQGGNFGEPVAAANQACCLTVLESLANAEPGSACLSENRMRFDPSPARAICCRDPASWSVYPACAPWGPPVPPELALETLLDWQAAA